MTHTASDTLDIARRWAQARCPDGPVPDDWVTGACLGVAAAVACGDDPVGALRAFVAERADLGFGFTETVDDIRALLRVLPPPARRGLDRIDTASVLAEWVRHDQMRAAGQTAFEPVSGFPRWPYLVARLDEFYRSCDGVARPADESGRLHVLDLGSSLAERAGLVGLGLRLESAFWLRQTFVDGESLVSLGPVANALFAIDREGLGGEVEEVLDGVVDLWETLGGDASGLPRPCMRRVPLPSRSLDLESFVRGLVVAACGQVPWPSA